MNELFFAMQKTAFHEFEPFCRKSHFRAKCTKSLLRASKNTILCLDATKQIRECEATDAQKASFSVRKSC